MYQYLFIIIHYYLFLQVISRCSDDYTYQSTESSEGLLHIEGLVQDCSNSIGLAMELLQSYTKPSILLTPNKSMKEKDMSTHFKHYLQIKICW